MAGIDANAFLVLLANGTNGSTTFIDSSLNPKTVTAVGGSITTATAKFNQSATGGRTCSINDDADFNLGSSDFTLEGWVYNPGGTLMSQYDYSGAGNNIGWLVFFNSGSSLFQFSYSTDGSNNFDLNVSWANPSNTWNHIAVCRSGNNLRFFVDGVQQGTTKDMTGITIFNSTSKFWMGGDNGDGTGDSYSGNWDAIRLSNIARYTADFTPPSTEWSVASVSVSNLFQPALIG